MSKCKAAVKEMAAETAAARGRKRKGEPEVTSSSSPELKTLRLDVVETENSGNSACEIVNCSDHHVSASCCSSNGSKSVDLEEEIEAAELIVTSVDSRDRRETTPLSQVHVQPGELESTVRPPRELITNSTPQRIPTDTKSPSDAELEEFFSAAEKNLQQKFKEKYNYDIVKDEPLAEGRYEWVPIQLKP